MKADLTHIQMLRKKAKELKLEGYERLAGYSDYSLYEIYNGAGPERWPEVIRCVITEILDLFEAAFLIHDVEFHESNGGLGNWIDSNNRCVENMSRLINDEYPVFAWKFAYNWLMRRRWKAKALAVAVAINSDLCFDAWLEAGDCDD